MFVKLWKAFAGCSVPFACTFAVANFSCEAADTKVLFDIPSKIECRAVPCERCEKAHPNFKVIEAKFRISAGLVDGPESSIEDFVYVISSPDLRLKVLDFLPNTTLESTATGDRIEVTDNTENADGSSAEAKVSYSLISLGATKTASNKKSESNHYERVAPKTLVLASGTTNRGYGVFYKLRPSAGVSLEGDKEFVVLCIVPKEWQGDWCTITCSARSHKKSGVSSKTVQSGIEQAHVGLYLSGNHEASDLADQLTHIQLADDKFLSKHLTLEASHSMELLHSSSSGQSLKFPTSDWLKRVSKSKPSSKEAALEAAKQRMLDVEERLRTLSGEDGHKTASR